VAAKWELPNQLSSAQQASTIWGCSLVSASDLVACCTAAFKEKDPKAFVCCNNTEISPHNIFRVGHKRNNYLWLIKHYEDHIVYEHVSQAFNYRKRHSFMSDDRKSSLWP
jgi:hypothetical protein